MDCPFGALQKRVSPARFIGQASLTRQSQTQTRRWLLPATNKLYGARSEREGEPPTPPRFAYGVWHPPGMPPEDSVQALPWRERG